VLEEEVSVDIKFLALTLKITDLSEIFVNHDDFCCQIILAARVSVRDNYATFIPFCLVELTVKPYSCAVARANLFFIV